MNQNQQKLSAQLESYFTLKSLIHLKAVNRNLSFIKCFKKFSECFWLQTDECRVKVQKLFGYLLEIKTTSLICIRTEIRKVDIFLETKFENLSILCLEQNRIMTIEQLSWIHMPQLKQLSLRNNYITQIRSLRKISFAARFGREERNMDKLSLDGNKIRDISILAQSAVYLQGLFLDIASYDMPCSQDIRCLAKVKMMKNCKILIDNMYRIRQHLLLKSLNSYVGS